MFVWLVRPCLVRDLNLRYFGVAMAVLVPVALVGWKFDFKSSTLERSKLLFCRTEGETPAGVRSCSVCPVSMLNLMRLSGWCAGV